MYTWATLAREGISENYRACYAWNFARNKSIRKRTKIVDVIEQTVNGVEPERMVKGGLQNHCTGKNEEQKQKGNNG